MERYFLAQDCSCHWYVVPLSRKKDWIAWINVDEDDESSWNPPDYAYSIGGDPSQITFTDPKHKEKQLFI